MIGTYINSLQQQAFNAWIHQKVYLTEPPRDKEKPGQVLPAPALQDFSLHKMNYVQPECTAWYLPLTYSILETPDSIQYIADSFEISKPIPSFA